ncbi:MAG: DUF3014 domain-containing protein [Vicinamibacterales bacterium]
MGPDDLDLNREDPPPPADRPVLAGAAAPPAASRGWLIAALIVLAIAIGGVARWWTMQPDQTVAETPAAAPAPATPTDVPIEPEVTLPPLEDMDPFLRALLGALSARPELARWLATDGLIQQMAMVVDRVSRGVTPARQLGTLSPGTDIEIAGRGRAREISQASFRRYDGLAETLAAADPAAVATAYRTIRPRLNEAYQNQGHPGADVDVAVQQALDLLIATPVPEPPVRVVEGRGATWNYADPELEALSPVQKQLLRLGPENQARVIEALKQIRQQLQP